jgi:hypothetical protein
VQSGAGMRDGKGGGRAGRRGGRRVGGGHGKEADAAGYCDALCGVSEGEPVEVPASQEEDNAAVGLIVQTDGQGRPASCS